MSYELRNGHYSPQSLFGSVVEHQSAKFKGLRFSSSQNFSFPDKKETSFSFPSPSSKLTIFLILYTKHHINIADPSSMNNACYVQTL